MRHSRGIALLTGEYTDRLIDINFDISVPAATGDTLAFTYTVGANIMARIEQLEVRLADSAAINQTRGYFTLIRPGLRLMCDTWGLAVAAGQLRDYPYPCDILMLPGHVLTGRYSNADGVARGVGLFASLREIDL